MNTLFKALSHPVRRRIIAMLRSGPLASGDIAAAFALIGYVLNKRTIEGREATSLVDSVAGPAGTRVTGHEFHRTVTDPPFGTQAAWNLGGRTEGFALDPAGTGRATLVASYLHTHPAGRPAGVARWLRHVTMAR